MKKYIIFLAAILLTGCSVEYNLKFNENTIDEKIVIKPETETESLEAKYLDDTEFYAIIDAQESSPYKQEKQSAELYPNYKYTYNYNFNNFNRSRFVTCYDAYSLIEDNNIVTFSTSKKFNCMIYNYMQIDNLKINITTDYKVTSHNADEVNGNVYTWKINNNNASNKPIKFSYNKKQKRTMTLKEFIEKNKTNIIIVSAILGALLLIGLIMLIRHKRVNKI